MKTFNRAYLPKEIKYNKKTFVKLGAMPEALKEHEPSGKYIFCCVDVLARRLRGAEDLHNRPYKPTRWLFGALKTNS